MGSTCWRGAFRTRDEGEARPLPEGVGGGWRWAGENPDEAAAIVLENDATGAQTEKHQKRMVGEINKLIGEGGSKGVGYLDPEDFQRTVKVLMGGGSDPVISKEPQGAWTHEIFEAMPKS
jgi:NitT/TauT family transport system substrate-binding protein